MFKRAHEPMSRCAAQPYRKFTPGDSNQEKDIGISITDLTSKTAWCINHRLHS